MAHAASFLVVAICACAVEGFRVPSSAQAERTLTNKTSRWHCPSPYVHTECVKSSWIGWKNDRHKFQAKCNGNLVRWGQDSGVQDCGRACFACSFIRACCDDCTTVTSVTGKWVREWGCVSRDITRTLSVGLVVEESSSWSRTEQWSEGVSTSASVGATVQGLGVDMALSAEASYSFTQSYSHSWQRTRSSTETTSWTQRAGTCGWAWETFITTTCGTRRAFTRDYMETRFADQPCCMPGMNATSDPYGACRDNFAGENINLCTRKITRR